MIRNKKGQFVGTPPILKICIKCNRQFAISGSSKTRQAGKAKFCSQRCHYAFGHTLETKRKISECFSGGKHPFFGKKHTPKSITNMSIAHKGQVAWNKGKSYPLLKNRGENHYNWQGCITSVNQTIRHSVEYKLWREAVFKRDDYTCQICFTRGKELQADHIKPFSLYPELRFAIDNGRTLCVECHKDTETWAGRIKTYEKKLLVENVSSEEDLIY